MEKVSFECWEMRFRFIRMTIRTNILAVVIFYPITSCLVSIRNVFFNQVFIFFCWICLIKSARRFSLLYCFPRMHIYIYILNDSLGWRKKKSRDFVNKEQKGAAKLLVQVLPPPACLVALFNYLIAFIMKSSINVSTVRASTCFKEG